MARHTTYRGATIDMDSMRRENERVPAIGNMKVNARGDRIKNGQITKTADEIARERGRIQSVLVNTGLKGPIPVIENLQPEVKPITKPITPAPTKNKEIELPSGDIIIGEENGNN